MPKSHHRARPSIDRALDLLADMDEGQMEALLQEANSTVAGNVAVSQAVDMFERERKSVLHSPHPPIVQVQPRPTRKFLTSLSPRKTAELRRRVSNRISSAPESRSPRSSRTYNRNSIILGGEPMTAAAAPSPTTPKPTSRSYKRISRPYGIPASYSPGAAQDLRDLLVAYLTGSLSPHSPTTTASDASSPASTRSFASSPALHDQYIREESPGLQDLLEPSPTRTLSGASSMNNLNGIFSSGGGGEGTGAGFSPVGGVAAQDPLPPMSGIFEVLDPGASSSSGRPGFGR